MYLYHPTTGERVTLGPGMYIVWERVTRKVSVGTIEKDNSFTPFHWSSVNQKYVELSFLKRWEDFYDLAHTIATALGCNISLISGLPGGIFGFFLETSEH